MQNIESKIYNTPKNPHGMKKVVLITILVFIMIFITGILALTKLILKNNDSSMTISNSSTLTSKEVSTFSTTSSSTTSSISLKSDDIDKVIKAIDDEISKFNSSEENQDSRDKESNF